MDDGVKSSDEFHTWLQFCHDRRLVFCDAVSAAADASLQPSDVIVVLRPAWLIEACQNLLSPDSRCCIQVWCYSLTSRVCWHFFVCLIN